MEPDARFDVGRPEVLSQPGKNHVERNRSPHHAGSPQVGC